MGWLDTKSLVAMLGSILVSIRQYAQRNPLMVVWILIVLLSLNAARGAYRGTAETITIYVGPAESNSSNWSKKVASELGKQCNEVGLPYRIEVQGTSGFDEIRDRVDAAGEQKQLAIGFGNTAFEKGLYTNVIAPLEHEYLHVLVSRSWFDRHKKTAKSMVSQDSSPGQGENKTEKQIDGPTLYTLFEHARSNRQLDELRGRIYPGPPQSSCQKLALGILGSVGLNDASAWCTSSVNGWSELRSALYASHGSSWKDFVGLAKENRVDIAFYWGPLPSRNIEDISEDNSCVLVPLGKQLTDAVANQFPKALPLPIHHLAYPGSYRQSGSRLIDGIKCETFAGRQVIYASPTLSDWDACQAMKAIDFALAEYYPSGAWMENENPSGTSEIEYKPNRFVAQHLSGKSPSRWWEFSQWPSSLSWAGMLLFGAVAGLTIDSWKKRQATVDAQPLQMSEPVSVEHTQQAESPPSKQQGAEALIADLTALDQRARELAQSLESIDMSVLTEAQQKVVDRFRAEKPGEPVAKLVPGPKTRRPRVRSS